MGNNVKYLARQLSKLCAQQKMKDELVAFVKERCNHYSPLASDLCAKDKEEH